MTFTGRFFDGESPREHEATVSYSGSFLSVNYFENGFRKEHSFRISDLAVQRDGEEVILTFGPATLIIPKDQWKKVGAPHAKHWAIFFIPAGLFFTLALVIFQWHDPLLRGLTELVPEAILANAEKEVKEEYGKKNCLSQEQEQIIESIFLRLGKNRDEFTIYLIPSPVKNAYAMPGKVIVFHDALLKDLSSLEAFTGILAHEVAHVEKDHLKRMIVKNLLTKWMIFAVFGDGGAILESIVSGKYNQMEEIEADEEAAKELHRANIDPLPVGKFFEKGKAEEDVLTKYLVFSHPSYEERVKTFRRRGKDYAPMRKEDWETLKKGCQSIL